MQRSAGGLEQSASGPGEHIVTAIDADAIVVGSGFAGALLADRLASKGVRTAILEAGPRISRAKAFETFRAAVIKTPESPYPRTPQADFPKSENPDHWYRQSGPDPFKSTYLKAVGGTSWHWLGTCVRYLPSDFQMRSRFGRALDWPIGYGEIEPFYLAAEQELGVAGNSASDLGSPRSGPFPMPPIASSWLDRVHEKALEDTPWRVEATPQARNSVARNGRPACCGAASCIPICPVGAKYDATVHLRRAEANGAVVHEQTAATFVQTEDSGEVSSVHFRRQDGSAGMARGQVYVLAANAVETPRLLLHSRSERAPGGVANRSDQVGRNLMDHPIQLSWALAEQPVWPYRGPLSTAAIENTRDGPFRRERSALRIELGNNGWTWPTGGAETLAGALAQRGLRGQALRQTVADHAARELRIAALTEQLPDPENRVMLHEQDRDPFGVPLPRMHYRVGAYSRAGLAAAREIHNRIFAHLNASETYHSDTFQGAGHILGTTRMGADPRSSVVNRDLRCHDHPNLFLVGGGAFPTGSTANPTLTIAALALRAADTVAATLR